jgi:hypothetical protein
VDGGCRDYAAALEVCTHVVLRVAVGAIGVWIVALHGVGDRRWIVSFNGDIFPVDPGGLLVSFS